MEAEEIEVLSDQEEFEKYILFGIGEGISFKECFENEVIFSLFFVMHLFIDVVLERQNHVFLTLYFLPLPFYFISVLIMKKGKRIEGALCTLHNGIMGGCFSYLFGLIGFEMLIHLFDGKERSIIICMAGAGYILGSILWGYITNRQIKKKKYSQKKVGIGSASLYSSCALLGMSFARTFLKDLDNGTVRRIVCVLCFFISYLLLISIGNILKYMYIVKHPEILNKVKPVVKKK